MRKFEEYLRRKFCPETAGDILLALENSGTHISWGTNSIIIALTWHRSNQKTGFWSRIHELAHKSKGGLSVDIYSLK